jgi:hypothetical protein
MYVHVPRQVCTYIHRYPTPGNPEPSVHKSFGSSRLADAPDKEEENVTVACGHGSIECTYVYIYVCRNRRDEARRGRGETKRDASPPKQKIQKTEPIDHA